MEEIFKHFCKYREITVVWYKGKGFLCRVDTVTFYIELFIKMKPFYYLLLIVLFIVKTNNCIASFSVSYYDTSYITKALKTQLNSYKQHTFLRKISNVLKNKENNTLTDDQISKRSNNYTKWAFWTTFLTLANPLLFFIPLLFRNAALKHNAYLILPENIIIIGPIKGRYLFIK